MSTKSEYVIVKKMNWNAKALIIDAMIFAYLLMVAAIAITRPEEETLLNLQTMAFWGFGSVVMGALVTLTMHMMRVWTLGTSIFEAQHEKLNRPPQEWYKTFWGWQLLIAFVITFVVGLKLTHFNFNELLDEAGFMGAKRIFSALLNPEWSILSTGIIAIVETIYIAFMATVIAIPFAFLFAFFAAKNIMGKRTSTFIIYTIIRTFLNITRSIEPLIWAIIFSVWVGIGPFAGMLALMFHTLSSLTKPYSELIESTSEGPIEGMKATGANSIQVVWFAIVPQVILPYIAFTIYRWDINVRMATVIGLVGGGGIGTLLIQYQGQALWREVGTLALLIVVVVWTMDTLSAYIREAIK